MAFDAGDIQGRLTLDRTPFTRELDKAQRQAKDFSKAKYTATLDADRSAFTKGINLARAAGVRFSQAKYAAKLSADRHELTQALKKAADDVRRFNKSNQGAGTSIGINEGDFNAAMKRISTVSRNTGIQVANNFQSPMRKIKWPAIFAAITAGAIAVPPALVGVGGAVAALAGAFIAPIKALTQFNKAADAVAEGSEQAAQQVAKYNAMLAKLTPEGRAFVTQAQGMRDEMGAFSKTMQREVLPGFTNMLSGLESAAPAITRGAGEVGRAVGEVAAATGELFRSTQFQGQLEQAFSNSVPVVRSLGMFVRNLFRDITTFTARTRTLGIGLSGMLDNVSDGFTRFFDVLAPFSSTLGQSFEGLGGIVEDLFAALGRFSGILSTGFGPGLSILRDALDSIYDVANNLLAGAMPGLTTAFSAVGSAVGGVASVLAPLAPLLGTITGALAPFAVALKAIDLVTFGKVGAGLSGLKGSIKAADGPMNKLKTAAKGLGGALGPVGIAAVALGGFLTLLGRAQAHAAEQASLHRQRVQELTQTIAEDGGAIGNATKATIAKSLADSRASGIAAEFGYSLTQVSSAAMGNQKAFDALVPAMDRRIAAMLADIDSLSAWEGAAGQQVRALQTLRTGITTNNAALKAAQQAALEMKAAENGVTTATLQHWNALNQLNSALLSSVDKNLAYREAQLQTRQATEAATEALKTGKKGSVEYTQAMFSQERAILSQITAKGEQVKATNALLPPERQAALATKAMQQEAFRLAQTMSGPGTKSLNEYIGRMSATDAQALGAKDSINSAGQAVRTLPNGKTIRIQAATGSFWDAIRAIQNTPISKVISILPGPISGVMGVLNSIAGQAQGGINQYATGGMTFKGRRVTQMSARSASMVTPGTPRLIGDNYATRESFIPHDKSRRSQSLLIETNRMMGDPLGVNAPVAVAQPVQDTTAAVQRALEGLEVNLYVGDEAIRETVRVEVTQSTRSIMRAVKAGAGRSR